MIVRVLLEEDDGSEYTMMFGDSYKKWESQFEEFMRWHYKTDLGGWREPDDLQHQIVNAWRSRAKWIEWGGIKWCTEEEFQHELDREGVQDGQPDNPNPRRYADMEFIGMNMNLLLGALRGY